MTRREKLRKLAAEYFESELRERQTGLISLDQVDELAEIAGDLAEVIWEAVTESVKEQLAESTVERAFRDMAARHTEAGPGKPVNGRKWEEIR